MEIQATAAGPVLEIAFNRPQRRNAITGEMYTMLADAFERGEADDAVRAFIVHGTPEAFTAGNDIEDFIKRPPASESTPVFRFLRVMSAARKPIVAAVCGPAVGIGTTLLLHCDLVYAGDNARFQLPFASLGLVPEFASSYLLPRVAGYQRAAELLLLGEPFDAKKAYECGFVTRVLPATAVLDAAREAARALASLPPKSIQRTKALMRRPHAAAVQAQLQAEIDEFGPMLFEPAARAALERFLARRKA
jgi:enoyl-CoA hydratase/carnithine racemase